MGHINVKRGPYKTNEAILEYINVSHTFKDLLKLYDEKTLNLLTSTDKNMGFNSSTDMVNDFLEYSKKKYHQVMFG